jgi:hypothetical protein
MKFSMTGQETCAILIQIVLDRGDRLGKFDCICFEFTSVVFSIRDVMFMHCSL